MSDFSGDNCKNNGYAKFCRVNKMHYGLCENGECEIVFALLCINTFNIVWCSTGSWS